VGGVHFFGAPDVGEGATVAAGDLDDLDLGIVLGQTLVELFRIVQVILAHAGRAPSPSIVKIPV